MGFLSGAFFQFNNFIDDWSDDTWQACFANFERAQLGSAILQFVRYSEGGGPWQSFVNKLSRCIANAPKNTKVWLGLALDKRLEDSTFLADPAQLDPALAELEQATTDALNDFQSAALLTKLGNRLAGWYVPLEIANYSDDGGWVAKFAAHLGRVRSMCREIVDTDVAISPYFESMAGGTGYVDKDSFASNLAQIVGSKTDPNIDVVMLQDSVAHNGITAPDVPKATQDWIKAIARGLEGDPTRLWHNHEAYGADEKTPADWYRYRAQLQLQPDVTRVSWQFPKCFVNADDGMPTQLFTAYTKSLPRTGPADHLK